METNIEKPIYYSLKKIEKKEPIDEIDNNKTVRIIILQFHRSM